MQNAKYLSGLIRRGAVSTSPAEQWEFAMVSGNGSMGAMLYGQPHDETVVANHCRLFLPLGSSGILPDMGVYLPEIREIIRMRGYREAHRFFLEKGRELGHSELIHTDPFHPGFFLRVKQNPCGTASDYARAVNFANGEITIAWREGQAHYLHRLFVSRADQVIVMSLKGMDGDKINCCICLEEIVHPLIDPLNTTEQQWFICHHTYCCGPGGYDGAVRVSALGGDVTSRDGMIHVADAVEVLLLIRIEPFAAEQASLHGKLKDEMAALPDCYEQLLDSHAELHGEIFNRTETDFGGGDDRLRSTEHLLAEARERDRMSPALLEKLYDAGRYMFICSSGERPPNLQGIWTGTWNPAWSSDYTLDTNLQLAIAAGLSGNMPEGMNACFRLIESFIPDFQENARKLFGCRGILSGVRASNTGLHLHWGEASWGERECDTWWGEFWTCGAGWLAHWFYDYYLYTGDRRFLADRAVPLMKECALFYEDFLFIDETGKYRFSPSYSAENGVADNSTQDIAVARELLSNLVAACEILQIEEEAVKKWKAMIGRLPPYMINEEGALKEWAVAEHGDHYDHRHFSHLYPLFQSYEFSEESNPELWNAAKVAFEKKLKHWLWNPDTDTSSHGRMHAAMCAARLGDGDTVWDILKLMARSRAIYPSLMTAHYADYKVFNVDASGAIPEIIHSMLVFSSPGELRLLPALPRQLNKGSVRGIMCRGQITICHMEWDMDQGVIRVELISHISQTLRVQSPKIEMEKSIVRLSANESVCLTIKR